MSSVERAFLLAKKMHSGQVDKSGEPYFWHPVAVADKVDTPINKIVALLHDVVEDTECSLAIVAHEFGPIVSQAVDAITKRGDEPYGDYLQRVKANEIACEVKIADISHNLERIHNLSESDRERLTKKYKKALRFLKKE